MIILGYFSYSSKKKKKKKKGKKKKKKKYVVSTRWKPLPEALLMSTHNICFMENWQKFYCSIRTV